ncbi:Molybdenum ABC transporter permease protein ModB [hydrothermal vent metagenome]|uniref:Molybdenum ABC transporter permease protein ModB n=1 Tax=hydrothermal vent metagenome TaxID=652676 RepID=A0A3B1C1D2_9ZZZZ
METLLVNMEPVWLTLRLAFISTAILLVIGTPLAWWLSRTDSAFKAPVEAVVALPMVLPPTVLGFYLLIALGPEGFIGKPLASVGVGPLAFTFAGIVVGSVLFSLPFVVRPLQSSFEAIGNDLTEAAQTLKATPLDSFLSITLPLARPGFLTAITLGFAHTVGEFGVVLMIGGNIPGVTQVLSIAIFNNVEALEYYQAHMLSAGLLIFSFVILLAISIFNKRFSTGVV